MKQKEKKVIKDAAYFGVRITVDKTLDKTSNTVLFPEKVAKANKILSKLKMPLPI